MTIEEFKNFECTFNESMFLSKVNNIFVQLLSSIMLDKLSDVKHFVSDDVYNWAENIVNNNKNNNWRQMYDELNVKSTIIKEIEVNESVYIIKVYLQSRYMDYIMNLSNGSVVSGNDNSRIQVNYWLTFTKKVNANNQGMVKRCPGCGAPLNVNASGKCEYCGAIYNQEDYDWILTKLEIS